MREAKEFDEEVIQIDRVTRVVKGGRRLRFRATVVVGNHKGRVGIGIGKSTEVQGAIQKAIAQAKKAMISVPIVGQTIPHRIKIKFKSAKLLLMPACPGTGIIAGGPLRKVIDLAGIKDILSKSLGCNNRVTNTQAALVALSQLKDLPWIVKKAPPAPVIAPRPETAAPAKTVTVVKPGSTIAPAKNPSLPRVEVKSSPAPVKTPAPAKAAAPAKTPDKPAK